jgi:hypothetical protein
VRIDSSALRLCLPEDIDETPLAVARIRSRRTSLGDGAIRRRRSVAGRTSGVAEGGT